MSCSEGEDKRGGEGYLGLFLGEWEGRGQGDGVRGSFSFWARRMDGWMICVLEGGEGKGKTDGRVEEERVEQRVLAT